MPIKFNKPLNNDSRLNLNLFKSGQIDMSSPNAFWIT